MSVIRPTAGSLDKALRRYATMGELCREAADYIGGFAQAAVQERELFTLALSGGKTPQALYELLAQTPWRDQMPWSKIHFFWTDERCVPPEDPDSNFGMARRSLLTHVAVPSRNIHRIPAERKPPEWAAQSYEESLRRFFGAKCRFPEFDLVLLGVGKEGHTASLFHGSEVLEEKNLWVRAVRSSESSPRLPRVTLTLPAINAARRAIFLASGAKKKSILEGLSGNVQTQENPYPAGRVCPREELLWFFSEGD